MRRVTAMIVAVLATLAIGGVALAGVPHEVEWFSIDGGGHMQSSGGEFSLAGTIGQPDAVRALYTSQGGRLRGGFWTVPPDFCFGDTDSDGDVDFDDLNQLLKQWQTPAEESDMNGDGFVDFADLNIVLENWGNVCD